MTTYDTLREIRRRTEVIASHDESAMVKAIADIYWLCKEWHTEKSKEAGRWL